METITLKSLFRYLRIMVIVVAIMGIAVPLHGQSISGTYTTGDIPTNLGSYSGTCNGPLTKVSITLPAGGPWTVTGIDISYTMTAQAGGFKSHQRSYVRCQNTSTSEDTTYLGSGDTGGIQAYNRNGVTITNGSYPGSTILHFEMRAWRTTIGAGCNTTNNKVDNLSWVITVYYAQIPDEGSVGIGTTAPASSAILDLSSTTQAFLPPRMTIQQRDAIASPVPGMIIFNTTSQSLEIYTSGWGSICFTAPGVRKLLGGTGSEFAQAIRQTSDGGFIIAGSSSSSNTGTLLGLNNNGLNDYWIIRLNNSGDVMWQKLLGGSNNDDPYSIQQTSDGGFIVAGSSYSTNSGTLLGLNNNGLNDYWILRLNSSGDIVWQKLLGGSSFDEAYSIQQTSDGGFIVGGYSNSSNTGTLTGLTNNGNADDWILKLDSNGNIVWQKLLGGSSVDEARSIQETSDGGFIVAGNSGSTNGTLSGIMGNGNSDYWILKLTSSGNIEWQKLYGGSASDIGRSIHQTTDGGYIVAGHSISSNTGTLLGLTNSGGADYWILRLDDSGNLVWQKLTGGNAGDQAFSVQQTGDGGFVVAGNSASTNITGLTNNGNADTWVIKMNSSGVTSWQKMLGGSDDDYGRAIQQTADDGFIIVAYSSSTNSGTLLGLTNNGSNDYWVVKLDESGNPY